MNYHCEACKGAYWFDSAEKCPKCFGNCYDKLTQLPCRQCRGTGQIPVRVSCPICNFTGELKDRQLIIC